MRQSRARPESGSGETVDDGSALDAATSETVVTGPVKRATVSFTGTEPMSAAKAVERDELARLKAITRVLRWLSISMLATLPFVGGNAVLRNMLLVGIALGIPMGYWFERIIDSGRLNPSIMRAVSLGVTFNGFVGIFYFGVFSGASMIAILALIVLSRLEFLTPARPIYLLCAVVQAVASGLIIGGVIEDPGVITTDRPMYEQIFMQVFYQVMYLGAYVVGVTAGHAQSEVVGKLERAQLQARQREALLHEARQDLDRALHVAVPGRCTDEMMGSFRLGYVIGRGAMAEVYEATHDETGALAAVKLLHPHMLAEPRMVARFLREARAAAALDTPHVAAVLEASDPLDPVPYLAMERLYGRDLSSLLRDSPRMSLAEVCGMVEQVGGVIDLARSAGIVHRDLKPQNLFRAELPDGRRIWKVLDFGVSVLAEGSGTLTQGHMVGTPAYMSAEQARGYQVDHRTDIHALAAIAYRCLTGRPPYPGRDLPAIVYAAVHTMPDQPSAIEDLPPEVDLALAIGLSKHVEDRYDAAASLAAALRQAARGELEPRWRERAARILAAHPWGESRST